MDRSHMIAEATPVVLLECLQEPPSNAGEGHDGSKHRPMQAFFGLPLGFRAIQK